MKKVFIATVLGLFAITAGLAWWYQAQLRPVSSSEQTKFVTVEQGMSARDVGAVLAEQELIRSELAFFVYAGLNNYAQNLQAGYYRLSPTKSTELIAKTISSGAVDNTSVQIPSGAELSSVKELLVESGYDSGDVRQALAANYDLSVLRDKPSHADLEGYLFPDTYFAPSNIEIDKLIEMILTHSDEMVDEDIISAWADRGLNIHEGLTLSSIVQREVSDPDEQRLVAQVFLSRLDDGMKLEADPTFMYAARQEGVSASVDISSPYNTYRIEGLPPGPIANSDYSAMQAVAEPSSTDYRFFVTGDDGVTRFSEILEQHERYIQEYGISGT